MISRMAFSGVCQTAPSPNKTMGCQELLKEVTCVCSGWLRRRSSRNRLKIFAWPRVYVLISGGCVYCYSNEMGKKPADAFSLYGYDRVFRAGEITEKEATWVFKLVHINSDYRSYLFSAPCEKEMIVWMAQIKQEMMWANGKLPRVQDDGDMCTNAVYQGSDSSGRAVASQDYIDIETSIYEESQMFVLPTNYTNKKEEDDSDDEMDTVVTAFPLPQERPPQPPPVPGRPNKMQRGGATSQSQQVASVVRDMKQMTVHSQFYKVPTSNAPVETIHVQQPKTRKDDKASERFRKRGSPDGSSLKKVVEETDTQDFWSAIFFYGAKEKASELIRQLPDDGVYLVRVNDDKSMVLHVYAEKTARKFQIFQLGGKYTLKKDSENYFNSVEELVYFFYTNPLPNLTTCLCQAYFEHPHYRSIASS